MGLRDVLKKKKGHKILIIEDEIAVTDTVVANLVSAGYEARAVTDSSQSLEVVQEWQPALILLDIMMPHPNGFSIYNDLRSNVATKHIPVIFMTVKDEEQVRKGIDVIKEDILFYRHHLQKPFSKAELLTKVRRILKGGW